MIELFFDGLTGKVVLSEVESTNRKGFTTVHRQFVSPAVFLKALHDYMLKSRELALKLRDAKKNEGTGGGIRIVLPSVPADPLLKPGQKPRPLRLLGQDPSKPLPDRNRDRCTIVTVRGPDSRRWCKETRKHPVDTPGDHVAVSAAQSTAIPCPCAKLRRRSRSRRADRGLRAPDLPDLHGDRDGQGRERHQHGHVRLLRGRGPGAGPGVGLDASR